MLSRGLLAFISVSATFIGANAANDWSKPCFDGECAYDLLPSSGGSGIIKLCGSGPFARIASMMVAEDQSLPEHAQGKISRRNGAAAEVHVVRLDGNFAAVDPTKVGEVNFAFVGATVPGLDLNAAFEDGIFDAIGNWVSNAANTVATAVTSAAKSVATWAGKAYQDVSAMIADKTKFEIAPKVESSDISLNADVVLSEGSAPPACPGGIHPKVDVEFHSKGSIKVKAGIVIVGSVIPPNIKEFSAFGGISGGVDAKLHIDLALSGGFHYEKPLLKDLGLPGLSVPPLITIGPFVSLDAIAQGHLDLAVTADIHLAYDFNDLELWYPKAHSNLTKEKGIKSKDTDLALQASAHLSAKGFVQGTITPKVHLGISAVGGAVSASLWVGADAWVRGTVVAEADASVSAGAAPAAKGGKPAPAPKAAPPAKGGKKGKRDSLSYLPPYSHRLRELSERNSIAFSGCFWIDAGLHLKGGAEGSIIGWKAAGDLSIWESSPWELFHKCWAAGTAKESKTSKPTYTLKDVESLSKGKQECSAHAEVSSPITDKVASKVLVP
ncbi:hypothetical protein EYR36_010621 [Pleurotus pulmonarius]|nr:hypothetical protein EYR36_010621 [Pleurotus pulmonarius]